MLWLRFAALAALVNSISGQFACADKTTCIVSSQVRTCNFETTYAELAFQRVPNWQGVVSAIDQGDYNCLGVDTFRLPNSALPQVVLTGSGGTNFVPDRSFGLWMYENADFPVNTDIVSPVFEYSVNNPERGGTITLTLGASRMSGQLDTFAVCDERYEYRIGPYYSEDASYVPYWEMCNCPSSCNQDSVVCTVATTGRSVQGAAVYAIPGPDAQGNDVVCSSAGGVVSARSMDGTMYFVPAQGSLNNALFAHAAGDAAVNMYTPGYRNKNIYARFPQGFQLSDNCVVYMDTSAVPSWVSNGWLSSAWSRVGAVGANRVNVNNVDSLRERAISIFFSDKDEAFGSAVDDIDHCEPLGLETVVTLHQTQEVLQSLSGDWSYRWARWGDDLSICTNQGEVDGNLRAYSARASEIEGTWMVLKVPDSACVPGLGYPALRVPSTDSRRDDHDGVAWVPYGQRVSRADVATIGEDTFAPLQSSITNCRIEPSSEWQGDTSNYFQLDEVERERFAFLTEAVRDATVSDLLAVKLNDLTGHKVTITCPINDVDSGCTANLADRSTVFRLGRVDDVDFGLCECEAFSCADGEVRCEVAASGVYGVVRTESSACSTAELDPLFGDGDAGDRTEWAVGFGVGIGLAFLLALCAWWVMAYFFGNACAWCCGMWYEHEEKQKKLIPLPTNTMNVPVPGPVRTIVTEAPTQPTIVEPPPITQIVYEQPPVVTQPVSVLTQPVPVVGAPVMPQPSVMVPAPAPMLQPPLAPGGHVAGQPMYL